MCASGLVGSPVGGHAPFGYAKYVVELCHMFGVAMCVDTVGTGVVVVDIVAAVVVAIVVDGDGAVATIVVVATVDVC